MTLLDVAHAEMDAAGDDATRRAFWGLVAAAELHLWLQDEGAGETVTPRLFEIEGDRYALAFDGEDRLAGFAGTAADYATVSGRQLATLLAGQGLGLGLNFGAPSETLLPPDVVAWLAEVGVAAPVQAPGRPVRLAPPSLSESAVVAIDRRLAASAGLVRRAWLAAATWEEGRSGHLLGVEEAVPGAAEHVARLIAGALAFEGSGVAVDVLSVVPGSAFAGQLARVALRFDPPAPEAPVRRDPDRPPRLR